MPPLENLEVEYPIINAVFQRFCASYSIFSVEDFLLHDFNKLLSYAEAEANSEVLKELCLHAASHAVDKQRGSVMFLDTCNSFSPRHVACIVNQFLGPISNEAKEKRLKMIMTGILCQSVYDMFALLDLLHQLELMLKVRSKDAKICLLVIDSISSLIAPVLGGKDSYGRSLMISAGLLLKKLAEQHNLAVLVTNHMVGGDGGTLKPALGESWKCVPHVRLLLHREQGSNRCSMSVLKHSSVACGRAVEFMIADEAP